MRVRRHQNGLCAESGTEQRSAPGIWADYTVGVIGSWSGERKYLSREEVGQLLSASDPKTRILAEMLRYFEGKTWIVSCADCQEAFGILADAEMREAFGLDEQEQIGPKLEM